MDVNADDDHDAQSGTGPTKPHPDLSMGDYHGEGLNDRNTDDSNISDSDKDEENNSTLLTQQQVLLRLEQWIIEPILEQLDKMESPHLPNNYPPKHARRRACEEKADSDGEKDDGPSRSNKNRANFSHNIHCRRLTSILLVASYCHELLQHGRITATLREVYYYFCTHFRSQSECNAIIQHICQLLSVQRVSLGLLASPKGWWCGCLTILDKSTSQVLAQGRHKHQSSHGIAIVGTPVEAWKQDYSLEATDAKCILVIESEGVYSRLAEESFWKDRYPCILVTGKGFPDFATRAWVQYLQQQLHLPAYGLCDCNPYGVSVMQTYTYFPKSSAVCSRETDSDYEHGQENDETQDHPLDLTWIGLRPSQLDNLGLPPTVLQQPTEQDHKRLEFLLKDEHRSYCSLGGGTRRELHLFSTTHPQKVELEALHWKGMDFLCHWLHQELLHFEHLREGQNENENDRETEEAESDVDENNGLSSYRI